MCVPPALQNWFSSVRDGFFCSAVSIPQRAANSNTKLSQARLFIRKNTLFFRKKVTFFSQMYHTTQTVRKAPTTGFFPFSRNGVGVKAATTYGRKKRRTNPLNERFLRPDEARRRRHTFCMARNRSDVWAEETPFKRLLNQKLAYTPPSLPCALG